MKKPIVFLSAGLLVVMLLISQFSHQVLKKPDPAMENEIPSGSYFLFLTDIHLDADARMTNYGDDTGLELWKHLKIKLQTILNGSNPPAFIIYTGDLPAHYPCINGCYLPKDARAKHNENLKLILTELRDLVSLNKIPFYYAPGNNDALSGDYYSFSDSDKQTPLSLVPEDQNPFPALNTSAVAGKMPYMASNPGNGLGYYAAVPIAGLRVMVLNSIIFGKNYLPVDGVSRGVAAKMQLDWLGEQLKKAKAAGEKVYLAMHIPPGTDAYAYTKGSAITAMWPPVKENHFSITNRFLALVNAYQFTISGIFYGHTHMDEVRRLYDSTGTHITQVAISCPGITPNHQNNPGFKMVYFNAKTKDITDFTTSYSKPRFIQWMDSTYSFSNVFYRKADATIYNCLAHQSLDSISNEMNQIYTVKHGSAGYDPKWGIEVKWEK